MEIFYIIPKNVVDYQYAKSLRFLTKIVYFTLVFGWFGVVCVGEGGWFLRKSRFLEYQKLILK